MKAINFGPGGGSLPSYVMQTGIYTPFSPYDAREDIRNVDVLRTVTLPTGSGPAPLSGSFGGFGAVSAKQIGLGMMLLSAASATTGAVIGAMRWRRGRKLRGTAVGALAGLGTGLVLNTALLFGARAAGVLPQETSA